MISVGPSVSFRLFDIWLSTKQRNNKPIGFTEICWPKFCFERPAAFGRPMKYTHQLQLVIVHPLHACLFVAKIIHQLDWMAFFLLQLHNEIELYGNFAVTRHRQSITQREFGAKQQQPCLLVWNIVEVLSEVCAGHLLCFKSSFAIDFISFVCIMRQLYGKFRLLVENAKPNTFLNLAWHILRLPSQSDNFAPDEMTRCIHCLLQVIILAKVRSHHCFSLIYSPHFACRPIRHQDCQTKIKSTRTSTGKKRHHRQEIPVSWLVS